MNDSGYESALLDAIKRYNADFMAGFQLEDCGEYDLWQFFQREEHKHTIARVLVHLVDLLDSLGAPQICFRSNSGCWIRPIVDCSPWLVWAVSARQGWQLRRLRSYLTTIITGVAFEVMFLSFSFRLLQP